MALKNQLHVDQLLSNISVKYQSNEFLAQKLFPVVPVIKDSDRYRIYVRNFRLPETKRANKGVAREQSFDVSTASYILENHALKDYVTQDDEDNYDISSLRADTTKELTDMIMRRMEKSTFDLITTTNWSLQTSLAATGLWTLDTTQSNPFPVVDTALSSILINSGYAANVGVISYGGFVGVKNHQSVLDRIKYTQAGFVTEQLLGSAFGIPEFYVSKAQIDSSNKGIADSIAGIFTDKCFLAYKPSSASPMAPSAGYIFKKNAPMVRRWRDEERDAEAIEVQAKFVAKVVSSLSGYLINNIE